MQSTLILSRENGAIVRASGLLVSDPPVNSGDGENGEVNGTSGETLNEKERQEDGKGEDTEPGKLRNAGDVAKAVWKFFGAAGGMVDDLRGGVEDEVRLLRLRMRRCEVVVVPGRFISSPLMQDWY